jgi:hypothetical protein
MKGQVDIEILRREVEDREIQGTKDKVWEMKGTRP